MQALIKSIKQEFPFFLQNPKSVYLDNGATTQKPQTVIHSLSDFYTNYNSNIHRGVHKYSVLATDAYEATRAKLAKFIGANSSEIVFTSGATAAINLVAYSYIKNTLKPGDTIMLTITEHHANIVPYVRLAKKMQLNLKVIHIDENGILDPNAGAIIKAVKPAFFAISHVTNVLGTINPIHELIKAAKAVNATVLVDGCQALSHIPVNVQQLNCDFYVASAHKMYGPTGVGFLYGKNALLQQMEPFISGGDMIETVSFNKVTYMPAPYKFEAGTPNIAGVIAFAKAIDFILNVGFSQIQAIKEFQIKAIQAKLSSVKLDYFVAKLETPILAFNVPSVHAHDVGSILDEQRVAIRAGHHCAMPLIEFLKQSAVARASFGIYNTEEDVNKLFQAILKVKDIFNVK